MLIIASRFQLAKPKLHRTAIGQSLRELRTEDSYTWAWAENFHFLQEEIGRLECENIRRCANSSGLSEEPSRLRACMPTHLAQEILLQFFLADTTELREAEILEMYPENGFEVQVALAELCDHSILAVAPLDHAGKLYVVTTRGQSLCFSCRTRVGALAHI
jgi:hypothetical protein